MQSFWQDMKYAMRSLRNSPGFAIIAVVTLGLGMAVNTTVVSVVNGLLLRSLPVAHAEQITVLAMKQPGAEGFQSFSYPDFQDIRSQAEASGEVFGYRTTLVGLIADGRPRHPDGDQDLDDRGRRHRDHRGVHRRRRLRRADQHGPQSRRYADDPRGCHSGGAAGAARSRGLRGDRAAARTGGAPLTARDTFSAAVLRA